MFLLNFALLLNILLRFYKSLIVHLFHLKKITFLMEFIFEYFFAISLFGSVANLHQVLTF